MYRLFSEDLVTVFGAMFSVTESCSLMFVGEMSIRQWVPQALGTELASVLDKHLLQRYALLCSGQAT
jgi:hypothetical protein